MRALLAFSWLWLAGASAAPARQPYQAGIDVLLSNGAELLRGKRVALITHPAAVTKGLVPTADALFRTPGVRLVALMGPEHGIRGAAYAGERVADQRDPETGLPVYSLYGKTAEPTPGMLQGVDVLVYDVQDIGARSYTFISTLALAMDAAAKANIPFVVLDRPDPDGGLRVEGNVPPQGWKRSFVDWLPIPYVYGMTPGELARMINGEGWLPGGRKCKLTVVRMEGWRRSMAFAGTGRPWVPTSPHIPRAETSFFYAATGILGELRVVNEGVGYPLPFELLGAPWIDPDVFAAKLNALGLAGVRFRPLRYKPFYGTYKGKLCGGVQIHLLRPDRAPWTAIQFYAIEILRRLYPAHPLFAEASAEGRAAFDRVLGGPQTRQWLEAGKPVSKLLRAWRREDAAFRLRRRRYLLYR
ncbi:MAG: DUF1343 domain-containing protein [Elusimicrobia bacterium]|nr:DUF1343 domain-containing protein [Elusimicrobiota bacterium]MDE2424577.1 DUF1343 domain-containing protein [Elusimicrobiota bacterium]